MIKPYFTNKQKLSLFFKHGGWVSFTGRKKMNKTRSNKKKPHGVKTRSFFFSLLFFFFFLAAFSNFSFWKEGKVSHSEAERKRGAKGVGEKNFYRGF